VRGNKKRRQYKKTAICLKRHRCFKWNFSGWMSTYFDTNGANFIKFYYCMQRRYELWHVIFKWTCRCVGYMCSVKISFTNTKNNCALFFAATFSQNICIKCLNLHYIGSTELSEVKLILQIVNYLRSSAWKFGRKVQNHGNDNAFHVVGSFYRPTL